MFFKLAILGHLSVSFLCVISQQVHEQNLNEALTGDSDYSNNIVRSFSESDDQTEEEKKPIDIAQKLKELGNKISSFFGKDNEENHVISTLGYTIESTTSYSISTVLVDNRSYTPQNPSPPRSVPVLANHSLIQPSSNVGPGIRVVEQKMNPDQQQFNPSQQQFNPGQQQFNPGQQQKFYPNQLHKYLPEVKENGLQDVDTHALPLLRQFLTSISEISPQRDHTELRRIQSFIHSGSMHLMGNAKPRYSGDLSWISAYSNKLKGFRNNISARGENVYPGHF